MPLRYHQTHWTLFSAALGYPLSMPAPPPLPDDDDAALFRAAIGPVRELTPRPPPPSAPPPRALTRMAEQDEREAWSEFQRLLHGTPLEAGDRLHYRRDEVPEHIVQRLARGQYAVQDELDLHHASAAHAGALLREFLHGANRNGHRCVRIIHGKGLRSDSGTPVLKTLLDRLLRRRSDVLAFHSAPAAQGGTGAVLVLLK